MRKIRVLWLDDDAALMQPLRRQLAYINYEATIVELLEDAISHMQSSKFELFISDLFLGDKGFSGLQALEQMHKIAPEHTRFAVCSQALYSESIRDAITNFADRNLHTIYKDHPRNMVQSIASIMRSGETQSLDLAPPQNHNRDMFERNLIFEHELLSIIHFIRRKSNTMNEIENRSQLITEKKKDRFALLMSRSDEILDDIEEGLERIQSRNHNSRQAQIFRHDYLGHFSNLEFCFLSIEELFFRRKSSTKTEIKEVLADINNARIMIKNHFDA